MSNGLNLVKSVPSVPSDLIPHSLPALLKKRCKRSVHASSSCVVASMKNAWEPGTYDQLMPDIGKREANQIERNKHRQLFPALQILQPAVRRVQLPVVSAPRPTALRLAFTALARLQRRFHPCQIAAVGRLVRGSLPADLLRARYVQI